MAIPVVIPAIGAFTLGCIVGDEIVKNVKRANEKYKKDKKEKEDHEKDVEFNMTICEANGYPKVDPKDPFATIFKLMKTPGSILYSEDNEELFKDDEDPFIKEDFESTDEELEEINRYSDHDFAAGVVENARFVKWVKNTDPEALHHYLENIKLGVYSEIRTMPIGMLRERYKVTHSLGYEHCIYTGAFIPRTNDIVKENMEIGLPICGCTICKPMKTKGEYKNRFASEADKVHVDNIEIFKGKVETTTVDVEFEKVDNPTPPTENATDITDTTETGNPAATPVVNEPATTTDTTVPEEGTSSIVFCETCSGVVSYDKATTKWPTGKRWCRCGKNHK